VPPIYLDYNATTPIDPEVLAALETALREQWGNPSSEHVFGQTAKGLIERARAQVAALVGADPDEIVFTGGGTEANNHAIRGVAMARRDLGRHLVTTAIEHPAVSEVMAFLAREGWEVTVVPVDEYGRVNLEHVAAAMRDDTVLVSAMHANNEIGTVLPIEQIADIAHAHGALMHTDAAQSLGKIPVRVRELGVDLLSVAGHKLYAPKGVGALYVKTGTPLDNLVFGAGHEAGRRPGTENTPYLVALGLAAKIALRDLPQNMAHYAAMRDRLRDALLARLPEEVVRVNSLDGAQCLPNTLSIGFADCEGDRLLRALPDIAASTGAACHAGGVALSPILQALRIPLKFAKGTLRLTTGRDTTAADVDRAASLVADKVLEILRRQ